MIDQKYQTWLASLPDLRLIAWQIKLWDRITKGDGYQPWGYDRPTLQIRQPEFLRLLDLAQEEIERRAELHPQS